MDETSTGWACVKQKMVFRGGQLSPWPATPSHGQQEHWRNYDAFSFSSARCSISVSSRKGDGGQRNRVDGHQVHHEHHQSLSVTSACSEFLSRSRKHNHRNQITAEKVSSRWPDSRNRIFVCLETVSSHIAHFCVVVLSPNLADQHLNPYSGCRLVQNHHQHVFSSLSVFLRRTWRFIHQPLARIAIGGTTRQVSCNSPDRPPTCGTRTPPLQSGSNWDPKQGRSRRPKCQHGGTIIEERSLRMQYIVEVNNKNRRKRSRTISDPLHLGGLGTPPSLQLTGSHSQLALAQAGSTGKV